METTSKLGETTGRLRIIVERSGKRVSDEQHNLIVSQFKTQLLHGLTNDGTGYGLDRIGLGVGVVSPTLSDTGITDPPTAPTPVNVSISGYRYAGDVSFLDASYTIPAYSISCYGQLGTSEGNGHAYTEAGLFLENNYMVARRVFEPKSKDVETVISFEWIITFTPGS
jgi:hypothetical protein